MQPAGQRAKRKPAAAPNDKRTTSVAELFDPSEQEQDRTTRELPPTPPTQQLLPAISVNCMTDAADPSAAPAAWGEPRSKTITWYDPITAAGAGAALPGIEYLNAIRRGELAPAPIAAHFGFQLVDIAIGEVTFTCQPDESAYNPIGLVHGGLVCTLLDSVLGCAVQSTLPLGVAYTSIELKVNYLRPVHGDTGELRARGWVTKPGRRVAFVEGDVRDAAGKVVATASGTCLVMTP
jgi:uncharacterized protein (TIGR00369 family)